MLNAVRLGCSTYSFWHFRGPKKKVEEYMEQIYCLGFSGVEVLENHLESLDREKLAGLKAKALELGLDIYAVAVHNDFVNPSKGKRDQEVEKVERYLEAAYLLGAKAIRVNSGRWRTIASFDELMESGGVEPPLEGYSDEDAYGWVVECLSRLVPAAEEYGVVLALENHWGLTRSADGVIRILEKVDSRWVRALMDTGNFIEDTYEQLRRIAPYTALVHAKTYFGGGEWYTLDIDYGKVFLILREVGYRGWISLEYEGREDPLTGVRKSVELLTPFVYSI